jgi:cardiolipin synthase
LRARQGHTEWALAALALAGVSDWADGALARHMQLSTVLGSYLDPLADKALIACVMLALAAKGLLPAWLAGAVLARDVALVGGALAARGAAVGWRWGGAREFFRMVPAESSGGGGGADGGARAAPAAPLVRPLMVSKVNTALIFVLAAAALSHDAWGAPDADALAAGAALAGVTTAASGVAYLRLFIASRRALKT